MTEGLNLVYFESSTGPDTATGGDGSDLEDDDVTRMYIFLLAFLRETDLFESQSGISKLFRDVLFC